MSVTAPRLAAAVLGMSLTVGLGALPAHAAEAAPAAPYASTPSVASNESDAPEEMFPEVVLRVVDRHGEEVELTADGDNADEVLDRLVEFLSIDHDA